jgi:hypothetical protein
MKWTLRGSKSISSIRVCSRPRCYWVNCDVSMTYSISRDENCFISTLISDKIRYSSLSSLPWPAYKWPSYLHNLFWNVSLVHLSNHQLLWKPIICLPSIIEGTLKIYGLFFQRYLHRSLSIQIMRLTVVPGDIGSGLLQIWPTAQKYGTKTHNEYAVDNTASKESNTTQSKIQKHLIHDRSTPCSPKKLTPPTKIEHAV